MNDAARLVGGRLLARNVGWNLLGQVLPLGAAVVAIPFLIHGLGTDRFGVLAIVWMIVGYFSLFDLGIGRALTQAMAGRFAVGRADDSGTLVWTAWLLMAALGVVGAIAIAVAAPWLALEVLRLPADLRAETLAAFYLTAASVPLVISTAGTRGLLEAAQRFRVVNAIRTPMGLFTFVGPLLVLPFSATLPAVVGTLVLGRLAGWLAFFVAALATVPALRRGFIVDWRLTRELVSYGLWTTVVNITSPILLTADRFIVGAIISTAAVAYYATPYEVLTKLWVVPAALSSVLFPAFAATAITDRARLRVLYVRGLRYLLAVLFPVLLLAELFGADALAIWVGGSFAEQSGDVVRRLSVGVLFSALALIPFTLLQGVGRPRVPAIVQLVEVPLYAIALWLVVPTTGIQGAAALWSGRVVVEALAFLLFADAYLASSGRAVIRNLVIVTLPLAIMLLGQLPSATAVRVGFAIVALMAFAPFTWFVVLSDAERSLVRRSRGLFALTRDAG